MMTTELIHKALEHLRSTPEGYTEEELRQMHRDLDEAELIVLRGIAKITERDES